MQTIRHDQTSCKSQTPWLHRMCSSEMVFLHMRILMPGNSVTFRFGDSIFLYRSFDVCNKCDFSILCCGPYWDLVFLDDSSCRTNHGDCQTLTTHHLHTLV